MNETNVFENNQAEMIGRISSKFIFDHETFKEKFYSFFIEVQRISDTVDTIPCLISERLIDVSENMEGTVVKIIGNIRTYNKKIGDKSCLILNIFVRDIEQVESSPNKNKVILDGYICKEPVFRVTPKGREVTDLLIAVNRPYGKTDYVPSIAWGRCARYSSYFKLGDRIKVIGRLQSREYLKKISEDKEILKTTYELSISLIDTNFDSGSDKEEE